MQYYVIQISLRGIISYALFADTGLTWVTTKAQATQFTSLVLTRGFQLKAQAVTPSASGTITYVKV